MTDDADEPRPARLPPRVPPRPPPRPPTGHRPPPRRTAGRALESRPLPPPPKVPVLRYGRRPEHPARRWLRHQREFLKEEWAAYQRMAQFLVGAVGLAVLGLMAFMAANPRFSAAVIRFLFRH